MTKNFTVTLHSFWYRIVILFSGVAAGLAVPFLLFPTDQLVLFAVTLVSLLALAWYLAERFSKAEVELSLTNAGLSQSFLKRFPLQQSLNQTILWNEISSYTIVNSEEEVVSRLKLGLRNGHSLILDHDGAGANLQNFQKLLQTFVKEVELYNSHVLPQQQIMEGKPFFKTKAGYVTVYATAAIILGSSFYNYTAHPGILPLNFFTLSLCSYMIYWVHNQGKHVLRNWF